jgi:GNAT superfamily N-acetyltransferase
MPVTSRPESGNRSVAGTHHNTMDLSQYSANACLRDGTPLLIRAIRPDDKQRLRDGFQHLSGRSIYFRFMGAKHDLSPTELRYFTEIDFRHHIAIVAALETAAGEQPLGVGRLIETDGKPEKRVGEIAFAVKDEYQNRGAGTVLFEHITGIARSEGFTRLRADVHTKNIEMLDIFRHSGYDIETRINAGVEHIEFDIA